MTKFVPGQLWKILDRHFPNGGEIRLVLGRVAVHRDRDVFYVLAKGRIRLISDTWTADTTRYKRLA